MTQLVASMSGVVMVVGSNLATASIGSVDSLYPSVYIHISLVRSVLDYGSTVWDSYLTRDISNSVYWVRVDIEKLERVQRQAARFITEDYHLRAEGSVIGMLEPETLRRIYRRSISHR